MNQTGQRNGLFHFRELEPFDFLADGIQPPSVVLLPRLLEIIFAHGTTAIGIATIILCEPTVFSGQRVEMVNERFIVFRRMRIEQIAGSKHLRPDSNVICNDAVPSLRQSLRNSRCAGKPVEHSKRFHFLNELKNVRKQLELRAGILDPLSRRSIHHQIIKEVQSLHNQRSLAFCFCSSMSSFNFSKAASWPLLVESSACENNFTST